MSTAVSKTLSTIYFSGIFFKNQIYYASATDVFLEN